MTYKEKKKFFFRCYTLKGVWVSESERKREENGLIIYRKFPYPKGMRHVSRHWRFFSCISLNVTTKDSLLRKGHVRYTHVGFFIPRFRNTRFPLSLSLSLLERLSSFQQEEIPTLQDAREEKKYSETSWSPRPSPKGFSNPSSKSM